MKSLLAFFSLIAGLGLLSLNAQTPQLTKPASPAPKTGLPHPELRTDATPVGEGKAPVLTSYADVLESVRPSVVSVFSSKIVRQRAPEVYRRMFGPLPGQEQKLNGLGSGVIISSDGYILTNNHVVEEADELRVVLNDERELPAKLIGTDPKTDIAVIKIDATNLPFVTLTDSEKLRVGDIVFAIGNPLGIGQTVTMGIVSATGRKNINLLTDRAPDAYENFIQTDAAINVGNSGGALIDAKGRLVGINSGIATNNRGNIGIGFAVPINLARGVLTSLIEHGTVIRGYMGVASNTLTPDVAEAFGLPRDTRGVVVTDLSPRDGPAAQAGIKREDIITGINGLPLTSRDDLRLQIAQLLPGTKVGVQLLRDGKSLTIDVTLGRLEDETTVGELLPGVTVQPLTPEIRAELRIDNRVEGIVVTDVSQQSPYQGIFPAGSVIEQINRVPVVDAASARAAMRSGRNLALIQYRGVYRHLIFEVR